MMMMETTKNTTKNSATTLLTADLLAAMADEAMGSYQSDLLRGAESWSGGSLRGAARQWGSRYARSRAALLDRLDRVAREDGHRGVTYRVIRDPDGVRRGHAVLIAADGRVEVIS